MFDGLYTDKEMAEIYRNMELNKIKIDNTYDKSIKNENLFYPTLKQRIYLDYHIDSVIKVYDKDIYLLKQDLTELYKNLTFSKEVLSSETINNFSKVLNNLASNKVQAWEYLMENITQVLTL